MLLSKPTIVILSLLIQNHHAFAPNAPRQHGIITSSSTRKTTTWGMVASPPIKETSETTTSSLIPPGSVDDESLDVVGLFDNVQKTYGRYPITITRGSGCKLYSPDGKEYLDFVAGIATCALGHGNPTLSNAIASQVQRLHHVSNLYYIPEQGLLAKWLVDNSCADKVFFCNSGAEANEAAIKLARRHAYNRGITDPVIITAHNSFHGRTLAALTATGQAKYQKGFGYNGEMVQGFAYTPYNNPEALETLVNEINTTPKELEAQGRKRGVAAILMEPLQGEGGITPGTVAFFSKARELCDTSSALLMCDEVQIGMGRSGTLWGHQQLGIAPDVFTSAKALGGGVPIGACLARGDAATVFGPGDHASTYGGNPLACAAGLAVAEVLSAPGFLEGVTLRGDRLAAGLKALGEEYKSVVSEVRGWGLLRGLALTEDAGFTAGDLVGDAAKEGLLLVPAGPNVVRFVPPLIVTDDEIDQALEIFGRVLKQKVEAKQ